MYSTNPNTDYYIKEIANLVSTTAHYNKTQSELGKVGDKIAARINSFAETVSGALGEADPDNPVTGLRDLLEKHRNNIKQQEENLAALQDTTQELLGVIGYGNTTNEYIKTTTTKNYHHLPQTTQIGPMVGCSINTEGDLVLESRGLWFIAAQTTFDWFAVTGIASQVSNKIDVYDPDGNLYATKAAYDGTTRLATPTILMPVTVKTPGYTVKLSVSGGLGRGVMGGASKSTLSVDKRSQETD